MQTNRIDCSLYARTCKLACNVAVSCDSTSSWYVDLIFSTNLDIIMANWPDRSSTIIVYFTCRPISDITCNFLSLWLKISCHWKLVANSCHVLFVNYKPRKGQLRPGQTDIRSNGRTDGRIAMRKAASKQGIFGCKRYECCRCFAVASLL